MNQPVVDVAEEQYDSVVASERIDAAERRITDPWIGEP